MRCYRILLRLYPKRFRDEFSDDLLALLDDLARDRGWARAWRICTLDLLVTVPRMHLERIMSPKSTTTTITWIVTGLAAGGVLSIVAGLYPGALLLIAAAGLAIAQRSALARAIRVRDSALRQRRLRRAAVLTVAFVACYAAYLATIGERWTSRETVLALVGTACMIGAACSLVAGLATQRSIPSARPDGS